LYALQPALSALTLGDSPDFSYSLIVMGACHSMSPDELVARNMPSSYCAPLAKVEWQLIMHCCDFSSLLRLARCSRTMLAAMDDPFSWKFFPLLLMHSRIPKLGARLKASKLLRIRGVSYRWVYPKLDRPENAHLPVHENEILAMQTIPNLKEVDATQRTTVREEHWEKLLKHPAAAGLTCLRVNKSAWMERFSFQCMLLASQLQQLSTLSLPLGDWCIDRALVLLPSFSELTDLQLFGTDTDPDSSNGILSVMQCLKLRRLALENEHTRAWHPVLSAPALSSLLELSLTSVVAQQEKVWGNQYRPYFVDWLSCWCNLSQLQRLTLKECFGVECMMEAMSEHPVLLRHLRIKAVVFADEMEKQQHSDIKLGRPFPSDALVERLSMQRPQLIVSVELTQRRFQELGVGWLNLEL
jgi:hypothetical protein